MQNQVTPKAPIAAPPPADAAELTEAEVARRLAQYGENALSEPPVSAPARLMLRPDCGENKR